MSQERFTIGTLAKRAGVNVETIRFYQRRGLLAEPERPLGGVRRYAEPELRRLRFIRAAQKLGFTLDEVAELLRLEDGMHCREAHALTRRKLALIRQRIAALQTMEKTLAELAERCADHTGAVSCPIIAALVEAARASPDSRPDGFPASRSPREVEPTSSGDKEP